jgi:oligoendopeptidase F
MEHVPSKWDLTSARAARAAEGDRRALRRVPALRGSRSPLDQLADLGLDPTRRETWQLGFTELERLVARAAE